MVHHLPIQQLEECRVSCEATSIYTIQHPTVQELETCRARCDTAATLKIIDIKLAATTAAPTALEETMSVEQLFELGSPLWARPYSVSELSFIIPMLESVGDETFKRLLGRATDYETLAYNLIQAL